MGEYIAEGWKRLGRYLGVREMMIQQISNTERILSERGYHVLLHWKQEKGSAATYQELCDALTRPPVQRRDLAEQFCYQYIHGKYLFFCCTEW